MKASTIVGKILYVATVCALFCGCAGEKTASRSTAAQTDVVAEIAKASEAATFLVEETKDETVTAPAPQPAKSEQAQDNGDVDVDLTRMSSTMVYSEVYNLMTNATDYLGKTIRMQGEFALYYNEVDDLQYYACIVADATACCAQGIEFVRDGDYDYPEDYPELGEQILVQGMLEVYEENGLKYIHLVDAEMTVVE